MTITRNKLLPASSGMTAPLHMGHRQQQQMTTNNDIDSKKQHQQVTIKIMTLIDMTNDHSQ